MTGFSVDIGALAQAAQGVDATVAQVGNGDVRDYVDDEAVFGDQDLAATVVDFAERWQIGVAHLAEDVTTIATQLTRSVAAYRAVEAATAQHLAGVLRGSGRDPAGPP